jgi:nicotinamidase-related amidase
VFAEVSREATGVAAITGCSDSYPQLHAPTHDQSAHARVSAAREMADPQAALIVIDMLNRYEHDDAELLIDSVRETLPAMSALIERARERHALTVYVNDNYGDWSAGRAELCEWALGGRHRKLIEPILPPRATPFVTKARHSAFYETQLDYPLRSERVERVVLVGQVTEQCILYSALDAYVRHYAITVPRDAVAHIHDDLAEAALRMMQRNMRAYVTDAAHVFTNSPNGGRKSGKS